MSELRYDALVIGSGQAGKPLAIALARAGYRTAIIERDHIGGSCVNVGCTPTKTMVASARNAYLARRANSYGVQVNSVAVDLRQVRQRKQAIVESFRKGGQRAIERTEGLDLLFGEAAFVGPRSVKVRLAGGETRLLSGANVFINTGCRPAVPAIQGLQEVPTLDSTSIMELEEIPRRLLIIGGGYVALEFGQMFRRFGSDVTIVQRSAQLLSREDADIAEEVAKILREDGIEVLLQSEALAVHLRGGDIDLKVRTPNGERTLTGSHLLLAAGRVPNSDHLNLQAAGVAVDGRGFIKVNEKLEASVPGVYALGDVKGGPAFTHISYDDFRIIRTNLLEGGQATITERLVPYTVFIDPQLGRVGITEKDAQALGRPIRVAKLPMTHVARAIEVGETRGFMKAVVDAESKQILGCAVLGIEGGELMSVLQVAMMGKIPYPLIKEAVFAHPTLAESLNNLFMTVE